MKNENKTQDVNITTETKRRGRPVVEGSKRQSVLAMRAEKRAAGIEIKRGRPKSEMLEIEVELEDNTDIIVG